MLETPPRKDINEETPLLHDQHEKRPTPLPKAQISILLLLLLTEPMISECIYPFINQLVSELDITDGDEKKVGYYAGLVESMFFVAEACTVLQWSRLSDHIGRRPVILMGLVGVSLSMICFGLSRTYWRIVVSRCLAGILNGNYGVIQGMMGELTDSTNIAQGSALMPIVWSAGATIGPLIGGHLSQPYKRFPSIFGSSEFWKRYPYFLPCAVSAAFAAMSFVATYFLLKEHVYVASSSDKDVATERDACGVLQNISGPQQQGEIAPPRDSSPVSAPLPLRSIMTPHVLIAVLNYSNLTLIEGAMCALQPLFFSTHIKFGGLGLSPPTIGMCLGAIGILNGVFQACFFAAIHRRFGTKRVFVAGMAAFVPIFATFPLLNLLAQNQGMNFLLWLVLGLQMVLIPVTDMSYACCFIYLTTAAPNKRSLGATHGLAQTASSVVCAIAPAAATSLFAISIERNLLGGWFVYVVLIVASLIALPAASLLPQEVWRDSEDKDSE